MPTSAAIAAAAASAPPAHIASLRDSRTRFITLPSATRRGALLGEHAWNPAPGRRRATARSMNSLSHWVVPPGRRGGLSSGLLHGLGVQRRQHELVDDVPARVA